MITVGSTYQLSPKFNNKKPGPNHKSVTEIAVSERSTGGVRVVERRNLKDRRVHFVKKKQFDRRLISDRRKSAIDFNV